MSLTSVFDSDIDLLTKSQLRKILVDYFDDYSGFIKAFIKHSRLPSVKMEKSVNSLRTYLTGQDKIHINDSADIPPVNSQKKDYFVALVKEALKNVQHTALNLTGESHISQKSRESEFFTPTRDSRTPRSRESEVSTPSRDSRARQSSTRSTSRPRRSRSRSVSRNESFSRSSAETVRDASDLTVPQLRSVLSSAGVEVPPGSVKKAKLTELYEKHIFSPNPKLPKIQQRSEKLFQSPQFAPKIPKIPQSLDIEKRKPYAKKSFPQTPVKESFFNEAELNFSKENPFQSDSECEKSPQNVRIKNIPKSNTVFSTPKQHSPRMTFFDSPRLNNIMPVIASPTSPLKLENNSFLKNRSPRPQSSSPVASPLRPIKKPADGVTQSKWLNLSLLAVSSVSVFLLMLLLAGKWYLNVPVDYCDTGKDNFAGGEITLCQACPENGICENGDFRGCNSGFKVYKSIVTSNPYCKADEKKMKDAVKLVQEALDHFHSKATADKSCSVSSIHIPSAEIRQLWLTTIEENFDDVSPAEKDELIEISSTQLRNVIHSEKGVKFNKRHDQFIVTAYPSFRCLIRGAIDGFASHSIGTVQKLGNHILDAAISGFYATRLYLLGLGTLTALWGGSVYWYKYQADQKKLAELYAEKALKLLSDRQMQHRNNVQVLCKIKESHLRDEILMNLEMDLKKRTKLWSKILQIIRSNSMVEYSTDKYQFKALEWVGPCSYERETGQAEK